MTVARQRVRPSLKFIDPAHVVHHAGYFSSATTLCGEVAMDDGYTKVRDNNLVATCLRCLGFAL